MSPPSHGRRASLDTLASFGSLLWAVSASQKQHLVVLAISTVAWSPRVARYTRFLRLPALGGFGFVKTTLSCFYLPTFNYGS